MIWHEVACPAAHQLDATELQVGKLLEAADAIVALGLPAAGFHTLALDECAPLQQPSQRAPVVAYLAERGVTLVFAARDAKPLGADAVQLYGGAAPGVARVRGAAAGGDVGRGRLERRARVAAGRRRRRLPARAAAALRAGRARRARLGGGARWRPTTARSSRARCCSPSTRRAAAPPRLT